MDDHTSDSIEILGLGEPLTVDSSMAVSPSAAAGEQDVMADMRAAVADMVTEPVAAAKADDAPADEAPVDDANADDQVDKPTDDKPAEDAPADKPADDKAPEEKPVEEKPAADAEEKPAEDDKDKEEAKPDEELEAEAEPSEADKLVEELGGLEVLKTVQPLVEAIYDPSLPVSERVSRLEAAMPEAQMKEVRNEVFWQAAETEEIREMLAADPAVHEVLAAKPELREAFAQKVFGVPFGYLEQIFNAEKTFLSDEEFAAAVTDYKETHLADKPKEDGKEKAIEKAVVKVVEKTTPKPVEKPEEKDEPKELTPAFTSILDSLSTDVDTIYATAQLEPAEADDADTARLKTEAAQKFSTEWPKTFMADEAAMKSYKAIKALADQGAEAQAKALYPVFKKHAQRVAAGLVETVSKPLAEHRGALKEKGKAAAAARTESAAAAKEKTFDAPASVDVTKLNSDAAVTRAMEEAIERNSPKG